TSTAVSLANAFAWATASEPRAGAGAPPPGGARPPPLGGGGGGPGTRLGRAPLGGELAVPADRVRILTSGLCPPRERGLEEWARLGSHELSGVPQGTVSDPYLNRRVHQ